MRVETERLPELLARLGHRVAGEEARRLGELPVDQALTALPPSVLPALAVQGRPGQGSLSNVIALV